MLHCDIVAPVSSNTAKVWIQPANQGQRVFFRLNKSTLYIALQNDGAEKPVQNSFQQQKIHSRRR